MQQKPAVIITTAYPEYAIEGFELAVTDYVLKPFSLERFMQAVNKVTQKPEPVVLHAIEVKEQAVSSVFVKSDKKIIKINFDDIHYVEAYGNYIKIYTDQMVLTQQTLSDFLEKLPSNFLRIHKSFVINFKELKLIDGNEIVLENEVKLPIGKSYKKAVLDRI